MDTLLILSGIYGSVAYTPLVGAMMLVVWVFLEARRARLRRKYGILITYPAMSFPKVLITALIGILAFIVASAWLNLVAYVSYLIGLLTLFVWWYVAYRIYRYKKTKVRIQKIMHKDVKKKPKKRVNKKRKK
ncbi:hypothetical protein D6777_03305 [Candidatus Woesearchaeota archaeon]|nr:MAG: hypothetical protein D6777_03305 [Candidatus Woesearchaeota archaeon]